MRYKMNSDNSRTICRLCRIKPPVEGSHIIPKFVIRWFKNTSSTGYLRLGGNVNLPQQDGIKEKFLCEDCEETFSVWEKQFSEQIFIPLHKDETKTFYYGDWLVRFLTSLSWRVLLFNLEKELIVLPPQHRQKAEAVLETWRTYLLGEHQQLGDYHQHLVLLGSPTEVRGTLAKTPYLTRYFVRAIDMMPIFNDKELLVCTKMCRILAVGFVTVEQWECWEGTYVSATGGSINSSRNITIPKDLGEFLVNRANQAFKQLATMSARQQERIETAMRGNLDQVSNSEAFRALYNDILLFGNSAFVFSDDNNES